MAYSETKVIIGGLAHVPILIFILNLIKGNFETKTDDPKEVKVKKEPIKVIEFKKSEVRKEEVKGEEELTNNLEEIPNKNEEVNKKVKKKKKKKKKNMKRD